MDRLTGPYEPPREARDARPAVILWYRVYAGTMALLSLALLLIAVRALAAPEMPLAALIVVLVSGALAMVFAVAAFVPFKPWGWTLGLVAIALGVSSGAVLFAIPLLVLWFRPRVKAAFARL